MARECQETRSGRSRKQDEGHGQKAGRSMRPARKPERAKGVTGRTTWKNGKGDRLKRAETSKESNHEPRPNGNARRGGGRQRQGREEWKQRG